MQTSIQGKSIPNFDKWFTFFHFVNHPLNKTIHNILEANNLKKSGV